MAQLLLITAEVYRKNVSEIGDIVGVFNDDHQFSTTEKEKFEILKVPGFTRRELEIELEKHLDNIDIESFDGLLVDFAAKKNAVAIIRGLRAISDFEFEFQMALMNNNLNQDITTVFLMPNEKYTYLNSTIVREVAEFGGNVDKLVTPLVAEKLREKFKK